jgi:elongation factor G
MNEPVSPVRPLVSRTLRPVNSDCEELRRVLAKLREENADFRVDDEDVDGQVIIRAMSELHLEVICDRLAREHNVNVECGKPEIIYSETIRDTSAAEGKFISQSGGCGYYAHVAIRIEPNPTKGYELVNEMPEGAIPDKYVDPIDQGIRYALKSGVAGHEMIDIKVTLCDGSYHEADSDEAAFETAGFMAMKEAVRQSRPVLMEPVISLEVVVPQQLTGSVVSDLKLRRAEVTGIEGHAGEQVIHAIARLAEVIGYAADLRSITQERATYSAALLCYRQVRDLPSAGDDRIGVTANKPWKPKPKRGAEAVEPPWLESNY